MSVKFRKMSAGEYLRILNRRKWHIILPTVAVFLAVAWVVRDLPNIYASTTFITIKPPTIPEKVAPSLTTQDLSQRLEAISQTVFSRSSLEPIIIKHKLYETERNAGLPIEIAIANLRSNIKVEPERTDDRKTAGFRLTYRDRQPETAQRVTAELADKYVNLQIDQSTQSAETTRKFIEDQLSTARTNLSTLEKQRLEIMLQNVETLPASAQGLIAQLDGLRQREVTISKSIESLNLEKGRLNDSISALNSQSRLIENFGEKETQDAATKAARIEDTPAYAQLIQKRAELNSRLVNLKNQYRDKHPDIIQTQTDLRGAFTLLFLYRLKKSHLDSVPGDILNSNR